MDTLDPVDRQVADTLAYVASITHADDQLVHRLTRQPERLTEGVRTRSRRPPWIGPLLVAAAVAAVATCAALLADEPASRTPTGAATSAHNSTTHRALPVSDSATAAVSRSVGEIAKPADCRGNELSAAVDSAHSGPALGTEQVVILFRNVGRRTCWLGGVPTLAGIGTDGKVVRLPFTGSASPAYADPAPARGAGPLAVNAAGALHLTAQLNDCSRPPGHYALLQIRLNGEQTVRMRFPSQLAITGCFGSAAEVGPI